MLRKIGVVTIAMLLALVMLHPVKVSADEDDEGEHHGRHLGWYKHHRHHHEEEELEVRRGGLICDEDGDYCRPDPNNPYYMSTPYGYNPANNSLVQLRNDLIYKASSANAQYYAALQRGDRVGAQHLLNALRHDQAQLNAVNVRLGLAANAGVPSVEPYYQPYPYNAYTPPPPGAPNALGDMLRQFMGY